MFLSWKKNKIQIGSKVIFFSQFWAGEKNQKKILRNISWNWETLVKLGNSFFFRENMS